MRGWTTAAAVVLVGCSGGPRSVDVGSRGIGPTLTPVRNVYLRTTGFDTDPSAYMGRFVADGTPPGEVDESGAMKLACSEFYSVRKVGSAGGYDEVVQANTQAAASMSAPMGGAGIDGRASRFARVKFELTEKWIADVEDPSGLQACCAAPDQCTEFVIGEFLAGTGSVFYADASVVDLRGAAGMADIEIKDGIAWRRSIHFERPVFFAFKLTRSVVDPKGAAAVAADWDVNVPRSSRGVYFVGVSDWIGSERVARDEAMLDARRQLIRYLGEQISQGSVRVEQLGGDVRALEAAMADETRLERASEGVARFLKDEKWKPEDTQGPDGMRYHAKVLAFIGQGDVDAAAAAAVEGMGLRPTL